MCCFCSTGWVKIVVAYVAVSQGILTADYCARFVGTYVAFPPGIEHSTVVICNGGPLSQGTALLFDAIPNCSFLPRVNDPGYDISAYQQVAEQIPCDMLCCLGESCYFHRPGWLKKMVEAWQTFGPGMYGFFSSYLVRAHLNTTAFVVAPEHLREYPNVTNHEERYSFEHGTMSLWRRIQAQGKQARLVTWDGCWLPFQWRVPRDILWKGTQLNCLAFCSHTDRYRAADLKTKMAWERWINGPFR